MQVIYPQPNHETHEESTLLIGNIPIGHLLKQNGAEIAVSAQGLFSEKINLSPGENHWILEEFDEKNGLVASVEMVITSVPPINPLPENTLAVNTDTLKPNKPITLMPGDLLYFSCLATPGATAEVWIKDLGNQKIPLQEESGQGFIDNRTGIFGQLHQTKQKLPQKGFYSGYIQIPYDATEADHLPIQLILRSPAGEEKPIHFPGSLSIWAKPQVGQTVTYDPEIPLIIMRTQPVSHAARLTPLLPETQVLLTGRHGHWYRVQLNPNLHGWIHQDNIQHIHPNPCPIGMSPLIKPVHLIQTEKISPRHTQVKIPLPHPVPLQIKTNANELTLTLYGVISHCDFIHYAPGEIIEKMEWKPITDETLEIHIALPHLCGYHYHFKNQTLILTLKQKPQKPEDWKIFIDPGHGGEESGSISPEGLPEKDLNLSVSTLLSKALKEIGFTQIGLTRESDKGVALAERSHQAADFDADLIISLHHNALPDGRNPKEACGFSTYYYHDFSQGLAKTIQGEFVQEMNTPDYGLFFDNLHMTRIHTGMAVLVEFGFLTHLTEYTRLISPEFQQDAAKALAKIIQDYCCPEK